MAPRLGNKKSRTGCTRCKIRRVKCDESKPACRNCSKHGVACEYQDIFNNLPLPNRRSSMPLPSGSRGTSSSSSGRSPRRLPLGLQNSPYGHQNSQEEIETTVDPDERVTLESRLLHHYASIVTYTLPSSDEKRFQDMWSIDAVSLGYEHPFLLNAILAISSLHLLSESGQRNMVGRRAQIYSQDKNEQAVRRILFAPHVVIEDVDLEKAHEIYLNLSIRQQREAISHLNPTNVDAIFLASVLLSYQSLRLHPQRPPLFPTYTPPTQWLSMCKAISSVIEASHTMQLEDDSVITTVLSWNRSPDFRDKFAFFNPLNRQPFEALLDYTTYPEQVDHDARAAYEHTVAYIGSTYRALLDHEPPRMLLRRLMSLGIMVPGYYTTLLAQGRPRALAILAQHFALTAAVDEHWWFRGAAEREVNGIRSVLPEEWLWAVEWPLQMIRVCKAEWLSEGI